MGWARGGASGRSVAELEFGEGGDLCMRRGFASLDALWMRGDRKSVV